MRSSPWSLSPKGLSAWLILAALALTAHLPAVSNGFVWDDDFYVHENPAVTKPGSLLFIWSTPGTTPQYYPMVFTMFRLEYRLWGANPMGYHVVNLFLHALAAVLAWRVLLFLGVPGAFAAAALFAVHPLHVESVAWITERKNVLSGVFYLGATLCFLIRWGVGPGREQRGRGWYVLGLLLFLGALLSKTVTATLPVGLAVLIWYVRGRVTRQEILGLVPLVAMGLALGRVTVWMERFYVGASGPAWDLSALERLLLAGRVLAFYVGKLAWPHPLVFIYPRFSLDAGEAGQYLYLALAAVVLYVFLTFRHRWGRGPAAALLWYAAALFPALGFFNVYPFIYSYVADHFAYLASLGPLALAAGAGAALFSRQGHRERRMATVVLAVVLTVLGSLAWARAGDFKDYETLWRRTLKKNPAAWIAHGNLGRLMEERGRLEEAMEHRRKVVELAPDLAKGHYNLGAALTLRGELDEALGEFSLAVALDDSESSLNALGMVLYRMGREEEAVRVFARILTRNPDLPEAQYGMGMTLSAMDRNEEAMEHFSRALALWESRPGFHDAYEAEAHRGLGRALLALGRHLEAMAQFEAALGLLPGDPLVLYDMGVARGMRGDLPGAAETFARVLEAVPGHPAALHDLGVVLMKQGEYARAAEVLSRAALVSPSPSSA
ncbi:MAG: tetratricopeptide repeat protein, partial [Proteobacteria bacterium]|nr:tetratricopeptide repeat protein [Pseudomonadota bacterium]